MERRVLVVPDMSCSHCEATVTRTLRQAGAAEVSVNLASKEVLVTFDPTRLDEARMQAALEQEGYPVAASRPA